MTREQKINLIKLIQDYFESECDPEDIKTYGYIIPLFILKEMLSMTLFNKLPTEQAGYDKTAHKNYYASTLTPDENVELNNEFKKIITSGAIALTTSRKAVRVSKKIIDYVIR